MIFAPRSCPSRPGFATTTRIFFSEDVLMARAQASVVKGAPWGHIGRITYRRPGWASIRSASPWCRSGCFGCLGEPALGSTDITAEHLFVDAVKGIAELYAGEAALPFVLAGAAGHKLLTAPNG